jgi:uncharacterized protein (DUF1697 family)
MPTYIALLRGINVGGKNPIKMADLVSAFAALGYKSIETYVQSGNVVFDCEEKDPATIVVKIEAKLLRSFGTEIQALVRTAPGFAKMPGKNPFLDKPAGVFETLYVTFLSTSMEKRIAESADLPKGKDEEFRIVGGEVFLYLPNGYGRTKLNNTLFEKKLGCVATTRNWKTVMALVNLASCDR